MKTKRIISIILSLCCILSVFQFGFSAAASALVYEVKYGKTYHDSVEYWDDEGIYNFKLKKPKTIKITVTSENGAGVHCRLYNTQYIPGYGPSSDLISYVNTDSTATIVASLDENKGGDSYKISASCLKSDVLTEYSIKVEDITPKVSLSSTGFTYNGKVQKPRVTIKTPDGNALTNGKDYTIKYSNESSKAPGEYSVKISYKGKFKGVESETYKYTIAPKAVTDLKISSTAKKTAKISFKKATGATGYVIYYSTSKSSGYKKLSTTSKTSVTNNKLKSGKTYYFKVKTYTKTSSGKTIYSAYSSVAKKKIK